MHVQLCSLHLNQFHLELGWDEEIPQKQLSTWNKWLDQLKELEMIKVDRCYKPSTFESVDLCQLMIRV
jgi:hypothetical protein